MFVCDEQSENVHLLDENVYVMLLLSAACEPKMRDINHELLSLVDLSMKLALAMRHEYTCSLCMLYNTVKLLACHNDPSAGNNQVNAPNEREFHREVHEGQ